MHVTQPVRRHTTDLGNCFVITYCTDDGAARLTMPTTDRRIIMEATGVDPFVITNQGAASLHLALERLLQVEDGEPAPDEDDSHIDKGAGATEREIDEARFSRPTESDLSNWATGMRGRFVESDVGYVLDTARAQGLDVTIRTQARKRPIVEIGKWGKVLSLYHVPDLATAAIIIAARAYAIAHPNADITHFLGRSMPKGETNE